jgi:hypothetical protein
MRSVDLAVYVDALAAERAALSARVERARSTLREAAIERRARAELDAGTVALLDAAGILRAPREVAGVMAGIAELEALVAAVEELQSWAEERLSTATELTETGMRP